MQQMVNAFSEYARAPEMNITPLQPEPVVGEVVDLYRSHQTHLEVKLELDEHIVSLEADRGRVRQILNNLITNAPEALDGRPNPRLEARDEIRAGHRCRVCGGDGV